MAILLVRVHAEIRGSWLKRFAEENECGLDWKLNVSGWANDKKLHILDA
jgi:hypothetical protein